VVLDREFLIDHTTSVSWPQRARLGSRLEDGADGDEVKGEEEERDWGEHGGEGGSVATDVD